LPNQKENQNIQPELSGVVFVVVEKEDILVNINYAEFVSEIWQIKARYRELKRAVGNIRILMLI